MDAVARHVIADLYLDLDEERHVSDHQTCTSCYRCTMMLLRMLMHIERKAEDCFGCCYLTRNGSRMYTRMLALSNMSLPPVTMI